MNHMVRYGLEACRHANGKSWWVVSRNYYDSSFNVLFISEDSITYKKQYIGRKFDNNDVGQSVFSSNGEWLAWYSKTYGLELLKFDKLNGVLSEYRNFEVFDTSLGTGGIAFSLNNRFIYVSGLYDLFQFDVEATDII